MYRFVRTSRVRSTRIAEGLGWAARVNAYVNGRFPDLGMEVFVKHFGEVGVVTWQADMDDLGTYHEVTGALMQDSDYHAMLAEAQELFIEGDSADDLYTKVDLGG